MTFPGIFDPLKSTLGPPVVGWVKFFKGENDSHMYPNMRAKFGSCMD